MTSFLQHWQESELVDAAGSKQRSGLGTVVRTARPRSNLFHGWRLESFFPRAAATRTENFPAVCGHFPAYLVVVGGWRRNPVRRVNCRSARHPWLGYARGAGSARLCTRGSYLWPSTARTALRVSQPRGPASGVALVCSVIAAQRRLFF